MTSMPTFAAPPATPTDARVPFFAGLVFRGLSEVRGGAIEVVLPDGRTLHFGDRATHSIRLKIHKYRFARRIAFNGDIGFAEGLVAGDWESDDLPALLTLLADNAERFMRLFEGGGVGKAINWLRHRQRANTRKGSKRNILAHYDLGNDFYAAWLDRSMTYSAARFEACAADLETAQLQKYRALAQHLDLKAGEHVLEIGCGWGGFAEFAAREYGVRVTGVTISDEQYCYARQRIEKAGLAGRVDIHCDDYRDITGSFDKVASIEMFEAVGERYWPAFFDKITQVLRPGGRAALQIITIKDDLFAHYRARTDFIQRHIFPGGMLASLSRLKEETVAAGLVWQAAETFGPCYAKTLAEWTRRFCGNWDEIHRLGFDERFKRLWLFYLGYCEAGFRTGRTNVMQLQLLKPASSS